MRHRLSPTAAAAATTVFAVMGLAACKDDGVPEVKKGTCVKRHSPDADGRTISCIVNYTPESCHKPAEFFDEPHNDGIRRCESLGARYLGNSRREEDILRRELPGKLEKKEMVIFIEKTSSFDF